nr:hypothetical protein StreXyl84_80370 [Streptomyces sp. Xyl84]
MPAEPCVHFPGRIPAVPGGLSPGARRFRHGTAPLSRAGPCPSGKNGTKPTVCQAISQYALPWADSGGGGHAEGAARGRREVAGAAPSSWRWGSESQQVPGLGAQVPVGCDGGLPAPWSQCRRAGAAQRAAGACGGIRGQPEGGGQDRETDEGAEMGRGWYGCDGAPRSRPLPGSKAPHMC